MPAVLLTPCVATTIGSPYRGKSGRPWSPLSACQRRVHRRCLASSRGSAFRATNSDAGTETGRAAVADRGRRAGMEAEVDEREIRNQPRPYLSPKSAAKRVPLMTVVEAMANQTASTPQPRETSHMASGTRMAVKPISMTAGTAVH